MDDGQVKTGVCDVYPSTDHLNPFARIAAMERSLGRLIEATEHPGPMLASSGWNRVDGFYVHPEVAGKFIYRDEAVMVELHRRVGEAKAMLGMEI
jgi:hypothetical protein